MYCFESQLSSIKSFITLSMTFILNYLNNFGYIKTKNKIKKIIKPNDDIEINFSTKNDNNLESLKIIRKCLLASEDEVKKQPYRSSNFKFKIDSEVSKDLVIINSAKTINEINKISTDTSFKEIDINTTNITESYLKSFKYSKWYDKYFVITPQSVKDLYSLSNKINQINLVTVFKNFDKINFYKNIEFKNNIFLNFTNFNNFNKIIFYNFKLNFKISSAHKFNFYKLFSNLNLTNETLNLFKYKNLNASLFSIKLKNGNDFSSKFNQNRFLFVRLNSLNIKLKNNNNIKKTSTKNKLYWWLFKD